MLDKNGNVVDRYGSTTKPLSIEKDIKKLEAKKVETQHKFADSSLSGEKIDKLSIELKEIEAAIEAKTERWFELSALIE